MDRGSDTLHARIQIRNSPKPRLCKWIDNIPILAISSKAGGRSLEMNTKKGRSARDTRGGDNWPGSLYLNRPSVKNSYADRPETV